MVTLKPGKYVHPRVTVEVIEGDWLNKLRIDDTFDLWFDLEGIFDGTGTNLGGPAMSEGKTQLEVDLEAEAAEPDPDA